MKYKLLGAAVCLCVIVLSILAPWCEEDVEARVHQHREAQTEQSAMEPVGVSTSTGASTSNGTSVGASTSVSEGAGAGSGENGAENQAFSTHLPLVEIDTDGVTIPGKAIVNERGKVEGYTTAEGGAETIDGQMKIVDHGDTRNSEGDLPEIDTRIQINVRGRSSRMFDKSSYAIRLIDDEGANNPQPVMGMDTHHEWVLYGPYLDKTLIRNYMWYNIGGEIMEYAPNVRFCEVILNGTYQGLYVMTESLTAGKDGARLNLSVSVKDNTFTGYLLRLDEENKIPIKELDHFTYYAKRTILNLDVIYPGTQNLTQEMADEINRDFSAFEKALYSYDYDHEDDGYKKWIDTQSFLDYFLINEFLCNYDAGWLSTYIYKDLSGRFKMCLWDLNSACDNFQESQTDPMSFQTQNCLWYFMLMKDEDFTEALINRYWQLRETYFNEDYLNQYVDETVAFLGDAVRRNYEVWGYSFEEEYDMLRPEERNPRDYQEAIAQLKEFFSARIAWMDENIDTLRQYSAESKVKKFNENAN